LHRVRVIFHYDTVIVEMWTWVPMHEACGVLCKAGGQPPTKHTGSHKGVGGGVVPKTRPCMN